GDFNAHDDFAFQLARLGCAHRERQHVGRLIVIEELPVEAMNRGVVDKCQRDLSFLYALAFQHDLGSFTQFGEIEWNDFLLVGDLDADHEATGSANRAGSSASVGAASSPRTSRARAA